MERLTLPGSRGEHRHHDRTARAERWRWGRNGRRVHSAVPALSLIVPVMPMACRRHRLMRRSRWACSLGLTVTSSHWTTSRTTSGRSIARAAHHGLRAASGRYQRRLPKQKEGDVDTSVSGGYPIPIDQRITRPMRNAAMAAHDAGATDKHGVSVPFSPSTNTGKSPRNPVPAIAGALQRVSSRLNDDAAKTLAREVLQDLLKKRYVTAEAVKLPSYKRDGTRNGSDAGEGLVCHWPVVPWTSASADPEGDVAPNEASPQQEREI